jgi:hypothetical protein
MESERPPNGAVAAAILSAGAGCTLLGILAVLGDAFKPIAKSLNFYAPTGPLSGVTLVAIVFWLVLWVVLAKLWQARNVALGKVNVAAFILLGAGVLLTFPPFADLLQGRK